MNVDVKNEPVIKEVNVNAPKEKVWKAISDRDEMRKWYFDLEKFKPEVGFEFQFYAGDEKQYLHKCKVTEVIPNQKLTYSWRYDGYPGNSYVTFELFPEGEKTRVKLTHSGIETFGAENPDLYKKENYIQGWSEILNNSFKNYFETQKYVSKAEIKVNASSSEVWHALTTPEIIKQYLFGTKVNTDWKEGNSITYTGEWQGKTYEDKGKIIKVIPGKLITSTYWSSMAGLPDKPENYKTITYELIDGHGATIVKITQDNNKTAAEAEHTTQNWNTVLGELKKVLEK